MQYLKRYKTNAFSILSRGNSDHHNSVNLQLIFYENALNFSSKYIDHEKFTTPSANRTTSLQLSNKCKDSFKFFFAHPIVFILCFRITNIVKIENVRNG